MSGFEDIDVEALIDDIGGRLAQRIRDLELDNPALIGIRTWRGWQSGPIREYSIACESLTDQESWLCLVCNA